VLFQKISILSPQKGLEFLGGGSGFIRISRGEGRSNFSKIPSMEEVWIFDIFWDYMYTF